MLTRFFRPAEAKASAAAPLLAFHGAGRAVWTPRDYASLARKAYMEDAVAHRCVRLVAEAAAAIPLALTEAGRPLATHPLLDLIATPGPARSGRELLEALYGHLTVAGNAYLEAAGTDGPPRELYALRPDRMRVVPGPAGWPAAWDYTVGSRTRRFVNIEDAPPVLHLKTFHPLNDHYGLSPLEAAAVAVDVHGAAARWAKALLDNAARPSGAVVYRGEDGQGRLTDDQYTRLRDELETSHQGARNAGRPMLLEGGLDWKPMGFSPADMEFRKTKDAAAREIALALGVPPLMLGLPGDNTHANYAEANRAFYRETIVPLVRKMASALTGFLAPRFGEALVLAPDLAAVQALAPERDAQWRRIAEADFLTDEEKRRYLGLS